jgi:GrpB-like predicted nucleotidyltransferase (UPF0157 family)
VATTGVRRTWARAERRVVVGTFVETARTAEADIVTVVVRLRGWKWQQRVLIGVDLLRRSPESKRNDD